MQTQDNTETCYQRGNRSTREKPLRGPLSQNDPLVNKAGIQRYQKDPPNLIYPLYLNPLSSSSQWTFRNFVFTSYSNPANRPIASPSFTGFFWQIPNTSQTQNHSLHSE